MRIGFGDRVINFVFGAKDEITPTLRNVKGASEELVRGLEHTSKRMEHTLDNLSRLVEDTSAKMSSSDRSFFSGDSLKQFRKEVEALKKVFEDMAIQGRQGFSDIANEIEMVGGRIRRTKGETGELKDQLRELSKFKMQMQDAAAAVGVGFGVGKVISDSVRVSEVLDTMALRMKNVGVTGKDLRDTMQATMSESSGYIGDVLSMMEESQKAGINNLEVMKRLAVDVERLAQFGGVDRAPLITMLAQMNTQLNQGSDSLHNFLEAANEMTKRGYGAGSLNETLQFVGGLTPQLMTLGNMRKQFGAQYGLRPEDAQRDMTRTQGMAAGFYRSFKAMGLDPSVISSLLSLPANETEAQNAPAVGTLMGLGGISYQDYSKSIMSGDLSKIFDAIERVAERIAGDPGVFRYTANGAFQEMGASQLFGGDIKGGVSAIMARKNIPGQSLSEMGRSISATVNESMTDGRDRILEDQREFMQSTAGQWRKFRGDMEQAFLNIARIFDVKNPPVSLIYSGLTWLGEKLKNLSGAAADNPLASGVIGGAGALAAGATAGIAGLSFLRSSGKLAKWALGIGGKQAARTAGGAAVGGAKGAAELGKYMGSLADGTEIRVLDEAAEGAAPMLGRLGRFGRGLGRAGRFLGRAAPWLAGAYDAYTTYQETKSVGKAAGAGAGSVAGGIGGAALGAALGQVIIPIPGVGAVVGGLVGGALGSWGGGAGGRMLGGRVENWFTGKKDQEAGPGGDTVTEVARSFAFEFVRELESNGFYQKMAEAVRGETPQPTSESWLDRLRRQGMLPGGPPNDAPGRSPTPQPNPVPRPTPAPPTASPGVELAPQGTPTPPTAGPGVPSMTPGPTPAPTPGGPGVLGAEPLGNILARKRIDEMKDELAPRPTPLLGQVTPDATPAPPAAGASPAPVPPAVPTTVPQVAKPSAEQLPAGSEPALGTRTMPTPRFEPIPVPTPSPVSVTQAAPAVNVNQAEVVRAVDTMRSEVSQQLRQMARADMTRRARNPLSRAADAMDI